MLSQLLEFVGNRAGWALLLVFVVALGLLGITTVYPLTFKTSLCTVQDSTYVLHNTTYRLNTVVQKEGGATVRLCIKEVTKTQQQNLVETPASSPS